MSCARIQAALAIALAAACGTAEDPAAAAEPDPTAGFVLEGEAELLQRAREEIGLEDFDAELERLRLEIDGEKPPELPRQGRRRGSD